MGKKRKEIRKRAIMRLKVPKILKRLHRKGKKITFKIISSHVV